MLSTDPQRAISAPLDLEAFTRQHPDLAPLLAQVNALTATSSVANNTVRAYASAFKKFLLWAGPMGLPVLPTQPEVVLLYLGYLRTLHASPSVVDHARYGIAWMHAQRDLPNPVGHAAVQAAFKGYARWWAGSGQGKAPVRAHPLSVDDVTTMIEVLPSTFPTVRGVPSDVRNDARALVRMSMKAELLTGWHLGRRLDELVRATVDWVVDRGDRIDFVSTSQKGKPAGFTNSLFSTDNPNLCGVTALREWLTASNPYRYGNGQLFARVGADADHPLCLYSFKERHLNRLREERHRHTGILTPEELEAALEADVHVSEVASHRTRFRAWMEKAGIEASDVDRRLSGHSLRRGLVTELHAAGVDHASISKHVGWSDSRHVETYSDFVSPDHPIARLGL